MSLFIKVKLIEFTADLINVTHARRRKIVRHEIIMVNAPYVEFIGVLMMNVTVRRSSLSGIHAHQTRHPIHKGR